MKSMRTNEQVKVSKGEYLRLKKLDKQFGAFLLYAAHLMDIEKAREEVDKGRLISQTALFQRIRI